MLFTVWSNTLRASLTVSPTELTASRMSVTSSETVRADSCMRTIASATV